MKFEELKDKILNGERPVIQFNNLVNKHEIMFDEYMKARITGFYPSKEDKNIYRIECDFTEFEEYNNMFMAPNFYDHDGHPTLKWCESNIYPKNKKEMVYIDIDQDLPFHVI